MVCGEPRAAVACASRSNRRRMTCASSGPPRAEHLGPNQLDGRVARQQPVLGAPDFAHPALAEPLHELVAAQVLRLAQLFAEALHHLERHHRDERRDVVRQVVEHRHVRRQRRKRREGNAIQATSGSIVRGRDCATSIRRGDVGEIVAKIRIRTAVHETIGMFGIAAPSADAFIIAMPSAFNTMKTRPIVVLVSDRCADERRYANIAAESAMPATSITVDTPLRGNPSAGTMSESMTSPNVQQPAMTTLEAASRRTWSRSSSSGIRPEVRIPELPVGAGVCARGAMTFSCFAIPCSHLPGRSSSRLMAID